MKNLALLFTIGIFAYGCNNSPQLTKEAWVEKPVSAWPSFALTNEISFSDTIFIDIANSFLINTGYDTIGVSCKHLFMVFENNFGHPNIELEGNFNYWKMYPKNQKEEIVTIKKLINTNSQESVGQYNTLKSRDWIIFELEEQNKQLFPLKIRYTRVKKDEILYALGWVTNGKDNNKPALIKIQCYKNLGNYFYIKPSKSQPHGMSGSPVIDKNGYLVGIVSGQEGKLGIMGAVPYLTAIFDNYGIKYKTPSH